MSSHCVRGIYSKIVKKILALHRHPETCVKQSWENSDGLEWDYVLLVDLSNNFDQKKKNQSGLKTAFESQITQSQKRNRITWLLHQTVCDPADLFKPSTGLLMLKIKYIVKSVWLNPH